MAERAETLAHRGRTVNPNALTAGDLNGDGRPDLVLLGDNGSLYFLPQLADHTLGEPQKDSMLGRAQIGANRGRGRRWPERFAAGGLGQPDAVAVPAAKTPPASSGRKSISRPRPSARFARTPSKVAPKITS